jgi:predicted enzyme related to lactoylglutathione lyase
MFGKLGVILLVVKDVDRSMRFYRDILGLKVLFHEPPGWSQLDAGNIQLGLHPEGNEVKVGPGTGCTFGFVVDDIRASTADLKRKNVRFSMLPRKEDFGWIALFTDPDGYVIQLLQMEAGKASSAEPQT